LALAVRKPVQVAALALLATPWDFHAAMIGPVRMLKAMAPGLNLMINQLGQLPIDVIQALFASLTPYSTATKFNRFAGLDPTSDRAQNFVALEDWLNDGVPLTGPVARECLDGWYGDNTPFLGEWRVSGSPVRGGEVRSPTLLVIPEQDHIVPPGSATALAKTIPGALTKSIAAGHIGMMTGSRAKAGLYQPLTKWLQQTLTVIN
jgi:poly(3-hydroxyalkanoate) synthetase